MFEVVEKQIHVELTLGKHQHLLACQIPNHLERRDNAYKLADPEAQWERIRSILDLVAEAPGNLKRLHFLVLPEAAMPADRVEETLRFIEGRFRPNTVTVFGVEHVRLHEYRAFLERWREDNEEVLASVVEDQHAGDIDQVPVNWAVTAVKEATGRLRVFAMAKSHPYGGEETIDPFHNLYRGKVFPLFQCRPVAFNFMTVICLDYIYRDLYQSNISAIIDKANDLFFRTRQRLDLLNVIECNPKPEHKAFRDVLNGFYGEYLAYTPGVRDAVTVFCNVSDETTGLEAPGPTTFGHSSIVMHRSHRLAPVRDPEFVSDDFGGLPVWRVRFGTGTRLCYFNLPLFHERDPRTSRVAVKLHGIYRADGPARWVRVDGSGG